MSYDGWRPVRFDDFVPGMKKSNWSILAWTLLFLVDLVLVFGLRGLTYNMTWDEVNQVTYQEGVAFFSGYEVLNRMPRQAFLMRDDKGNLEVGLLEHEALLNKYKVGKTVRVPDGEDVTVTIRTMEKVGTFRILEGKRFDMSNSNVKQTFMGQLMDTLRGNYPLGVCMTYAVILLLLEYSVYCWIEKLRE